jgi:hypothetical protein
MAGVIPQVAQVAQVHQVAVMARVAVIPEAAQTVVIRQAALAVVIPQAALTVVIRRVVRRAVAYRVSRRAVIPPATQALRLPQQVRARSPVILCIQEPFEVGLSLLIAILALAGGTAIGGKAKKPWIGSAIIGADCSVSFGINQLGSMTHPNLFEGAVGSFAKTLELVWTTWKALPVAGYGCSGVNYVRRQSRGGRSSRN